MRRTQSATYVSASFLPSRRESMETPARQVVTRLLREGSAADEESVKLLIAALYDELHGMAHRTLAGERRNCTLSTTALLHEAYFKLVDDEKVTSRGRDYFFAACSRAMRQVVVDHARRRGRVKRGGGLKRVRLEEAPLTADGHERFAEVIEVDRALRRLAAINLRAARVVEGWFFGGLSLEQTGRALGISGRTAKRDWAFARAWLYRELADEGDGVSP